MAEILKFSFTTYSLARVQPLQAGGRTEGQTTDDNHANSSTVT